MHVQLSSRARGLKLDLSIHIHPTFVYVKTEVSLVRLGMLFLLAYAISITILWTGLFLLTFGAISIHSNRLHIHLHTLGCVAQSVTCLATNASLTAGPEFNSGRVRYFGGDCSWNNFYGHSPPFCWFILEGLLSVTSESMCTKYWLTACSSLPRKKCD